MKRISNTLKAFRMMFILFVLAFTASIMAYDYPSFYREPIGDLLYADHYAAAWCGQIQDVVDGPSLQISQGNSSFTASDRYGNCYICDINTHQILQRDPAGNVRVIAGTGEYGFLDGPAGQAQFFIGPSGYNPYFTIKCDDSGRVYVSDPMNSRLRMIYKKADGRWWVSTVSGGGTQTPALGQWLNGTKVKYGCASAFGILPDGSAAYYAYWGGLYKVQINHQIPESSMVTVIHKTIDDGTILPPSYELYYQWKSGCMMSPDSLFTWSPMDPSAFFRYDEKTNRTELYAGSTLRKAGYDSTGWRLDARWFTHLWCGSPSGRTIISASGDDVMIRRMYNDTVKHLKEDGTFAIMNCGGGHCGWNANALSIDFKGHFFYTYGVQHMASPLIARMTFENSDTTDIWETQPNTAIEMSESEVSDGVLLYVFPNPLNPTGVIHYNLGTAWVKGKTADITIFNIKGERIHRFDLEAGEGDIVLKGKDEMGRPLAAGHYFAVLKNEQHRLVKGFILAK